MKNPILATIASLALIAFAGPVSARTQPANLGTARVGTTAPAFTYSFINGSVFSSANADWASGLSLDTSGLKNIRIAGKATAVGAQVRVVSSDFLGNFVFAAAFQPLPVSAVFLAIPFVNVPVPSSGTIIIDAIMNPGASIGTADYNQ